MKSLKSALADELMYQGYTASRSSGFRPALVQRAIKNSKINRWISAVVSSALIVLYIFLYHEATAGALPLRISPMSVALIVFAWSGFSVITILMMAMYSLQGVGYIRDFIYTLPIEEHEIEKVSVGAIFSLMDLQVYAMALLALASLLILRSPLILFSIAFGLETAIIIFEVMTKALGKGRSDLRRAMGNRLVITAVPIIYILIFVLVQTFPYIWVKGPVGLILPLADFAYANSPVALFSSAIWIVIAGYFVIRLFRTTALSFFTISPEALTAPVRPRGWRITGPTLAVLKTDMRQVFRSNLAGMFLAPLILAAVVLLEFHGVQVTALRLVAITYGIELALLSTLPAYSIYMAEMRGALAIRIMPLSRVRLALPKIIIALLSYYIFEGALIAALLIRGAGVIYTLPLMLGALGPAASVLFVSLIFEKTITSGGAFSMPVAMAAFLLELFIVAVPFAFYFAAVLLGLDIVYASAFELVVSAIELAILYYTVSLYDKG